MKKEKTRRCNCIIDDIQPTRHHTKHLSALIIERLLIAIVGLRDIILWTGFCTSITRDRHVTGYTDTGELLLLTRDVSCP